MTAAFRHIDDRVVHHGHIWHVAVGRFEAPDGVAFERDIVRSPGAVAAVPLVVEPDGTLSVVLVGQYRAAFDADVIEIPAGMRDVPGEPPEETARRELVEEVGLAAGRLDMLTEIYPSSGMTDAVTTIFVATGCAVLERAPHGPEEDHARVLHIPFEDAIADVVSNEIHDAKTVAGLLLAERWWAENGS